MGAVPSLADENARDYPINYTIPALSSAESNYSAFKREELDVIVALKKFQYFLTSNKFKLYTEYQALKYVCNMNDPHGLIAR